jgi:branched-subunit amino acid ABC-type transport system permease component
MNDIMVAIGFGLITASILALSAVALSMQYAVSKFPNFAHGELMTIGAYGAYVAQGWAHNVVVEALAASLAGGALGFVMNWAVLQPFIRRGVRQLTLFVLTIAIAIVVQSSVLFVFGGSNVAYTIPPTPQYHIGPFLFTGQDLIIMAAAVVAMLLVHVLLRYTKFGKAQRAVADNRDLARVTGINTARVVELTWLLAGLIAGFAGFVLAVSVSSFGPTIGFTFLVVTFAAAVVGEIGKIYGAMLGALIVGVAMEVSALYIAADYKTAIAFGLLVVTLLFRPQGLFTRKVEVA